MLLLSSSLFLLVGRVRHREVKCKATQLVIAELKLEPALPSSDAYSITIYKGKYHIVPCPQKFPILANLLIQTGVIIEPFPKHCHFPIEAPKWAPSRWQGTFHSLCIQKPDGPLASDNPGAVCMPREHLPWGWLKNDSSVSSCGRAPWVIGEIDWSLLMSCVAYNRVWQVIGCIWVSTPSSGRPWNSSSSGWSEVGPRCQDLSCFRDLL